MISRLYCPQCRSQTVHEAKDVSHVLHLILSVLTGGLWLPIWLWYGLGGSRVYHCRQCGSEYRSTLSRWTARLIGVAMIAVLLCVLALLIFFISVIASLN